ncbi:leucine--tRNA ligase [Tistrella sp. BH-R2-4]|uniref:Leucine--tRNA ligase n=1 Tax=Tistrella arctica TaxID=3133430 RepID=A0ABU9YLU8_9PROT
MMTVTAIPDTYDHRNRDRFWQDQWQAAGSFAWRNDASRPKYYVLEMFPYTSGRLHIGHARNYSMGDTLARMQRARGFDVLYPMGWDAFGLPAENAAVKFGTHPGTFTAQATVSMKRAMHDLGLSYSWANELSTCSPDYIRAQQVLFLRLLDKGLILRDTAYVNWDPVEQTVLANEQVIDGKGWRSGAPIVKRRIPQWFFNIRSYAAELHAGLDRLDGWPDAVRNIQRSWIGQSDGVEIDFPLTGRDDRQITVFTTRADTVAGCTFLALAAEHQALDWLIDDPERREAVYRFRDDILKQTAEERTTQDKRGVDTGVTAINPLTGEPVPVLVANYVLADYGVGAIMGVPAHDERDLDFARAYDLDVRPVIRADDGDGDGDAGVHTGEGVIVAPGTPIDGLTTEAGRAAVVDCLAPSGRARHSRQYRLQNWSISRQRYWGNPIPIIHCADCGAVPVPERDLPVLLPQTIITSGEGSPLSRDQDFMTVACPSCGKPARRDPDTMDTFVDSSWYYMRFPSPYATEPVDSAICNRMLPVDVYIGGVEHATLHLIYARFMTKALRDLGLVDFDEPFLRLYNQGMVNDELGRKQSKSLGNVVEPMKVIEEFGADALRVYLLFKTSYNAAINWEDTGPRSARQYLERVQRLVLRHQPLLSACPDVLAPPALAAGGDLRRKAHETIAKVTRDVENFQFNTAIAALMTLTNELYAVSADMTEASEDALKKDGPVSDDARVFAGTLRLLIRLLAPFAPHIAEELWQSAGQDGLLANLPWPEVDPAALVATVIRLPVQVNGRTLTTVEFAPDVSVDDMVATLVARRDVQRRVGGGQIRKVIHVPNRIINLVVA